MLDLTKKCTKCGEVKNLIDFYKSVKNKDGKNGYCKECSKASAARWDRLHKERRRDLIQARKEGVNISRRKYSDEVLRNRQNKKSKEWRRKNRDRIKSFDLQKRYGIDLEQFNLMFAIQRGNCAICRKSLNMGKGPQVDHDHKTGKVRQLLCSGCNLMLGVAKDNLETLQNAIKYLTKHHKTLDPEAPSTISDP